MDGRTRARNMYSYTNFNNRPHRVLDTLEQWCLFEIQHFHSMIDFQDILLNVLIAFDVWTCAHTYT